MEEMKYTYRELKQFLSGLSEEQLDQTIMLAEVERPTRPIYPLIMEDDYYYHCDEYEDGGTMAELREIHEGEDDFEEANYLLGCKKGTVLFFDE